ncbi:MAG: tRNA dihydrouridine(20/20a) synthase DusA [Betaproteobacteria bacterium]
MKHLAHRFCTAPMMDWSDRHCRYLFRQLTQHAMLYTEMITSAALMHGDVARHLQFNCAEHPVALQLGGSDPSDMAYCASLGQQYGYDEININCGCPSERVQHGSFGACLMAEPQVVADCVRAMRERVAIPITVKHRLGIDRIEDYDFARRFIETVAPAGCATFIVHARNAVLRGLSPKDNREVPALRYDEVYQLQRDFPEVTIVINGGIEDWDAIDRHLEQVDGAMLGRAAYHNSYLLAQADRRVFSSPRSAPTRDEIAHAMFAYAQSEIAQGAALRSIVRHMLGLFHGQPNARIWRHMLSDARQLASNDPALILAALQACQQHNLADVV